VVVPAVAGYNATTEVDTQNAVSEDGSRIFISAERQTSPDPAEIGRQAVFVREDGRETRDVSLSETAVPDEGAQYQWATADGSKVFFTANAGLTQESNSEGTDLYEYNLETEKLTDRSITQASGGAQVKGFLGASADGSQVYFASRNQLVAGQGNSRTENVSADSYSIYDERGTEISFVGTFNERDDKSILIAQQGSWDSQVSPDGRYLLFESSARNTGYENQGVNEVYLYDADSEETTCVSCRQDGQPSPDERYGDPGYSLLARGESVWNPLHPPQFLTERNGEAQVFFNSPDALAPGAVAGENNIYEWAHDQIFRLASAPKGSRGEVLYPGITVAFGGASQTGSDVYLITPETLTWEDGDQRLSAYDARIGGGYPEPPPPPPVCGATSEGQNSCLGPPQGAAGTPGAATTGDAGAQNFEPRSKKQKKHGRKGKKHKTRKGSAHKRHKKKSQPKKQKKSKRQANGNRRNGK
jgi:Tol biopolymer transport system component